MQAVSGALYRPYANVMINLVTSWCEAKKKIHDTQFGFYPHRNTLHCRVCSPCLFSGTFSMLHRLNTPAIDPDIMPLLLISNRLMTLSHKKPFETTCTAFACLPLCSAL